MAELLKCNICGYKTVRSGMTNHLKAKHPLDYIAKPINELTTSLGQITCAKLRELRKKGWK